jgi:hypothetical protein
VLGRSAALSSFAHEPVSRMNRHACFFIPAIVAGLQLSAAEPARARDLPQLNTNQAYVEEAARATSLDVADPMAVFAFVLASLPDRVKVYPTENYYYFTFLHKGVPYAGNIRLDASNRDEGKVSFGYYEDYARWKQEAPITFRLLDAADGVRLEKVDRFRYRLSYGEKIVLFELNDLTQSKPPALGPDETFIGPIFDESGLRFFLIYNAKLKIFHYVLRRDRAGGRPPVRRQAHRPDPDRQAQRICLLSGPPARPQNPDRRLLGQRRAEQLLRRPVRPAARQFHRGRDAAQGLDRDRPEPQGPDRSLRRLAGRRGALHDRSLSHVSHGKRSRLLPPVRDQPQDPGRQVLRLLLDRGYLGQVRAARSETVDQNQEKAVMAHATCAAGSRRLPARDETGFSRAAS